MRVTSCTWMNHFKGSTLVFLEDWGFGFLSVKKWRVGEITGVKKWRLTVLSYGNKKKIKIKCEERLLKCKDCEDFTPLYPHFHFLQCREREEGCISPPPYRYQSYLKWGQQFKAEGCHSTDTMFYLASVCQIASIDAVFGQMSRICSAEVHCFRHFQLEKNIHVRVCPQTVSCMCGLVVYIENIFGAGFSIIR